MNEKYIGYTPETVIKTTSFSEMPKLRNTEQRAETLDKSIKLNLFDQQLSQLPTDLLDAIATKMASKDISAESFSFYL